MDKQLNEIVKVVINDARSGSLPSSVNTVAMLVNGLETKAGGVKCASIKDFEKICPFPEQDGEDDKFEIYRTAIEVFFAQDSTPAEIVILGYEQGKIKEAIENAAEAGTDFYHIIYLADSNTITAEGISALNVELSSVFKICHVQADFTSEQATALSEGLKAYDGLKRVALYVGNEESMVAPAIVSQRCGLDPAKGTWANKTLASVKSIDKLTLAQIKSLKCFNQYKNVAGEGRLFFDYTASGGFIDETIKQDWIKFNIETAVYNALRTGDNGYGIPFNDAGISSVAAIVGNILTIAADNSRHYIREDFSVKTPLFADVSDKDKKNRNLSGVEATCSLMGSIHTVLNITVNIVD